MPASAGREVPIVWNGRRVRAFVPVSLGRRDLTPSPETVAASAEAGAAIVHAAEALAEKGWEPVGRLLLRAEGVASSYIEGVRAPLADVVLAESNLAADPAAAWVAANLAALREAVSSLDEILTTERLLQWHRLLMAGSPTPERFVGRYRDQQGWIGGHDPTDAHLVTPPPAEVEPLMEDLLRFVNGTAVDGVTQAGVAHAQFEIIHPFADGNGRVGRILAGWVLARRLRLVVPPPLSTAIAADVGGYTSGLTWFRLGDHDRWLVWWAQILRSAARGQSDLVRQVDGLVTDWHRRLRERPGRPVRSDAAAWRVVELLPRRPVVTAAVVAADLGLSTKGAGGALAQLAAAGILERHAVPARGRGQPAAVYAAPELLGLIGSIRAR